MNRLKEYWRRTQGNALLFATALLAAPLAAQAQDAAVLLEKHLYAGTLAQGTAEFETLAQQQPGGEAQFALGGIRSLRAVERLAQSMHRHGLQAPHGLMLPILRIPVPPNPNPAPLTYEGFRLILQQFGDDLAQAEAALAGVTSPDPKLTIDLARVRLDLNGDGTATEDERLWSILGLVDPRARGRTPDTFVVAFDKGDVYWLRGYCHLMMGMGDFWLAHDFRAMFDQSFHQFFPRAQLPSAAVLGPGPNPSSAEISGIADVIAFVHLFNWSVVEPTRLERAYAHFKAVPALSRESWKAILAETDDDHEWIPNPRQTNPFPSLPVTQERIDAWLAAMAEFEAVLDGTKLVPHWRFQKGINFKRALVEHKTFDPVMWTTGVGVLPFLEDGPVISTESWNAILATFGGSFFGYAVWFN